MLLIASNLSKKLSSHHGQAFYLKNINLKIEEGRVLCIIGKSGAGKSTLLRLLAGLDHADTGAVYFQGVNLYEKHDKRKISDVRRSMSLVSQGYHLLSNKNVFDNVALPLVCQYLTTDCIEERVHKALKEVGLNKLRTSYPSQLSGGQRQRVAIARAIVTEPQLLLCDEITSALDPQTTDEILDLLKKIKQNLKLGIILITHDLQVVKKIADEVCVIDKGEVVEHGRVFDILINPSHSATKSLAENLINRELPAFLRHQIQPCSTAGIDDIVLKLGFDNKSSTKPIISALMENFHIPVNILAGTLDHIGMETFGHLYISMRYSSKETKKILQFLANQNITIETIGYIQWA